MQHLYLKKYFIDEFNQIYDNIHETRVLNPVYWIK